MIGFSAQCSKDLETRHPMRTRRLDRKVRIRMLPENKSAVIYGGGGKVGGAIARAFAREGARVSLAGLTLASLDEVAEETTAAGGVAQTVRVDALDEWAVEEHADEMVEKAGGIDVSFNAIFNGDVQGRLLAEMPFDDFARPIMIAVRNQFLTARTARSRVPPPQHRRSRAPRRKARDSVGEGPAGKRC
jgi:3-oxoacyl-[acyl-carrier protein] reductase